MINWISTADPSRKPEPGKPMFIRGIAQGGSVDSSMATVWVNLTPDELNRTWNWEPYRYNRRQSDTWDFVRITHWAEIPEGLFNEPTA